MIVFIKRENRDTANTRNNQVGYNETPLIMGIYCIYLGWLIHELLNELVK